MRRSPLELTLLASLALAAFPSHATTLSYGYDANGNRISGGGQYFEYDDANRLVRVRQGNASGSIIAEFFYDHTGQRIKKIENGVTTYYIGKHFEVKQTANGPVNTNYYFAGMQRVAKKEDLGSLSFYHANHLGSTEAISDASGNLVSRTKYFPFGEMRQGGAEKYSFTGKERDAVSGQYYFEARYYASSFKHFTQADIIVPDAYNPQSLNRYSYVINNPVKFIDPTGHELWDLDRKIKESAHYLAEKTIVGIQYAARKISEHLAEKTVASNRQAYVKPRLSLEEKQQLMQQMMSADTDAAYYSTLEKGYKDTMKVTVKASLSATASVVTLGLASAAAAAAGETIAAKTGVEIFGKTIIRGGISIWNQSRDDSVSNAVDTTVQIGSWLDRLDTVSSLP